jgi:hypothetical protein
MPHKNCNFEDLKKGHNSKILRNLFCLDFRNITFNFFLQAIKRAATNPAQMLAHKSFAILKITTGFLLFFRFAKFNF